MQRFKDVLRLRAIKVTECLKEALGLDDDDVAIIKDDFSSEDAWRLRKSGFEFFEEDLWLRAIEHLMNCERCRRELKIAIDDVLRRE